VGDTGHSFSFVEEAVYQNWFAALRPPVGRTGWEGGKRKTEVPRNCDFERAPAAVSSHPLRYFYQESAGARSGSQLRGVQIFAAPFPACSTHWGAPLPSQLVRPTGGQTAELTFDASYAV